MTNRTRKHFDYYKSLEITISSSPALDSKFRQQHRQKHPNLCQCLAFGLRIDEVHDDGIETIQSKENAEVSSAEGSESLLSWLNVQDDHGVEDEVSSRDYRGADTGWHNLRSVRWAKLFMTPLKPKSKR